MIVVPHGELSPEALRGLIEDFVTRDGTDYGEIEVPLDVKCTQVLRQLKSGIARIVFNEEDESFTILTTEQLPDR
jgi:uncharacterized protein